MKLNLDDLIPQEVTFKLAILPDKPLTLCRWSLRVRAWALGKYGHAALTKIFEEQSILEIADICFFMLKNKPFETLDDFMDAVTTPRDHLNLITALLGSIGIAEPKLEEIKASMKSGDTSPNVKSPSRKKTTGARSSTR